MATRSKPSRQSLIDRLQDGSWSLGEDGLVSGDSLPSKGSVWVAPPDPDLRWRTEQSIGKALWWSSEPHLPPRPWHALVASRGVRLEQDDPRCLRMIELALREVARSGGTLLVPPRSPLTEWVEYAAATFHIPWFHLHVTEPVHDVNSWLHRLPEALAHALFIGPSFDSDCDTQSAPDAFLMAITDVLTAIRIRPGGLLDRLMHRRLACSADYKTPPRFMIRDADASELQFLDHGAVGWYLPDVEGADDQTKRQCDHGAHSPPAEHDHPAPSNGIVAWRDFSTLAGVGESDWSYLAHCTRAVQGPWPDESTRAWRDRLFFSAQERPHAMVSLQRILAQRILRGHTAMVSGETPVVCFSARHLESLLAGRSFRSHLSRWDYEPYGIAIQRESLERLGARPVIYGQASADGGKSERLELPPEDRPFFQPCGRTHDWTWEQEWRITDKVPLDAFASNEAFVFVATSHEARQLHRLTPIPWPIVYMND